MHIPVVQFKYSWVYDLNCKDWSRDGEAEQEDYPTSEEVQSYLQEVKKQWADKEVEILQELSKISGLPWHDAGIPCYIVGSIIPFSDPLTIPVYATAPDYGVDVLVHELIHQLFTQGDNLERASEAWKYIDQTYSEESNITRIHIPLHAIHAHIYHTFFSEGRLNRDVEWISFVPDYKRSWDVVMEEGYQKILKNFCDNIVKKSV